MIVLFKVSQKLTNSMALVLAEVYQVLAGHLNLSIQASSGW